MSAMAGGALAQDKSVLKTAKSGKSKPVYLVVYQPPPNRHVLLMPSMKACQKAIGYSSARCIRNLPKLPDVSTGHYRTLSGTGVKAVRKKAQPRMVDKPGRAYLVIYKAPPNRHVIAMKSMKKCLEAAENSNAQCVSKLPKLPNRNVGRFRNLEGTADP